MAIGLFVLSEMQERMDEDPHSPVITCDTDEIEIPVDYTQEQLMEGVHAEDQEDGVRGKVILQPHGKEFFTWYSKHLFTLHGKHFFT